MKAGLKRKSILSGIALIILGVGAWLLARHFGITMTAIHEEIARWPVFLIILAMVVFPIFGFSIGVVYLVAGSRFGSGVGMLLVTGAIAIHLLAAWWISKSFLRARVERWLKRRNHKLPEVPEGEDVSLAVLAALVPGIPYAVRNYLLALSGINFKAYFWICLPIYALRASLGIFIGDFSKNLTPGVIIFLASFLAIKLAICGWLLMRIRRKARAQREQARLQLKPA